MIREFKFNDELRTISLKPLDVPETQTVTWDLELYAIEKIDFNAGKISFRRIEKELGGN